MARSKKPLAQSRTFIDFHLVDNPNTVNNEFASLNTNHQFFGRMLKAGFSPLEAQWAVFWEAWGVPCRPVSQVEARVDKRKLPRFFLPENKVWLDILDLKERDSFELWLDRFAPIALEKKQPIIILFGPPVIRMPLSQGWALILENDELIARPIHLAECPHCNGFDVVSVGTPEEHKANPSLARFILERASTPKLKAAYAVANGANSLLH